MTFFRKGHVGNIGVIKTRFGKEIFPEVKPGLLHSLRKDPVLRPLLVIQCGFEYRS